MKNETTDRKIAKHFNTSLFQIDSKTFLTFTVFFFLLVYMIIQHLYVAIVIFSFDEIWNITSQYILYPSIYGSGFSNVERKMVNNSLCCTYIIHQGYRGNYYWYQLILFRFLYFFFLFWCSHLRFQTLSILHSLLALFFCFSRCHNIRIQIGLLVCRLLQK